MTTYIALLRGINVGGKQKVKMAELREMLEELGYGDAKTLLQSGNVVFRGEKKDRGELEATLEEAAEKRFGFRPAFHVRTAKEWDEAIEGNPFPEAAKDDASHLLIVFLKKPPVAEDVEKVQSAIEGPELVRAGAEHLYIHYPDDIGHSKVDRTPGWKKLNEGGTGRNWNTVLKLQAMAAEL